MSKPACPMCEMTEVLEFPGHYECVACGHEWERAPEPVAPASPRVVKDAHGNILSDGGHEISCKMDGVAVGLKACFVKKA